MHFICITDAQREIQRSFAPRLAAGLALWIQGSLVHQTGSEHNGQEEAGAAKARLMSTTRFYSCRLVGPPSAEFCRTSANS